MVWKASAMFLARRIYFLLMLIVTSTFSMCGHKAHASEKWFEDFKKNATDLELYQFLYALPKGGDLHNHLSGSNFSEWWYELAVDKKINRGYQYYTKVKINNCSAYGSNMYGFSPYLLLFVNLQKSSYDSLSDCEKGEYKKLEDLSEKEKSGWLNSIRLDKKHEGREEFFQTHWQRLKDLAANPYILAEMIYKNMQAFGQEGLVYLELQEGTRFYKKIDGTLYSPEQVADIFRERIQRKDAKDTGVTVKMQYYLLRFIDKAEEDLEWIYRFVDQNRDLYVGINMVGREDNDKGYPLRFLSTLRKLRQKIPAINLAIHAGEVDEPNHHVKDTLLLGAKRIGHGVNLITDPDTMLLMRNNDFLVEINLVSNLLLEYVDQYSEHPFPEYLRTGIPVALSTDDRGMWDSNMTDEYFVAVKEFNLSWSELVSLGRNSLVYSFLKNQIKQDKLSDYEKRIAVFEYQFRKNPNETLKAVEPVSYGFLCKHYQLCFSDPVSVDKK